MHVVTFGAALAAALTLGIASAAPCDNTYLPTSPNRYWVYQSTAQATPDTLHYETSPKGFSKVYEWTEGGKAQRRRVPYQCVGGNLTSLQVPQFGGATITRASVSGVDIPAAALWKTGYSWASVWNLSGKQGLLSGNGTFERHYRIAGREKITVPAGTFEAWRVEVSLKVTGKAAFMNINREIGRYTVWYAQDMGELRTQHKNGVSELQKITGPEE